MAVFPTRRQQPAEPARQSRTAVQRIKHGNLTWYNFTTMGEADFRYLQRQFKFHPLDHEDVRSTRQRPKLEDYPGYLFIIFHVPFFDRRSRRLVQEEVDVFVGPDYFVTIHSGRLKVLNELFTEIRQHAGRRHEYMGKGSGFLLYESISRLFENAFPMLDRIAERINVSEHRILEEKSQEALTEELSHLKLEIINFRRIIRPQRALLDVLEEKKKKFLPDNLEIYFDDVQDTVERTADLLDNYKEIVESLEDTNETFIQHRTNNLVKMLTLVSLVTLPLSTTAALLGMNVDFPFSVGTTTFFASIILSIAAVTLVYIYIFFKRWL